MTITILTMTATTTADCQSQDDVCDNSEGCESESVVCIDDRGSNEADNNG